MFDLQFYKTKMSSSINALKDNYVGLRTSRASTSLLDPIVVDAYGSKMPINQVASVSTPEARLITVQVWDQGLVSSVEKAIRESDLGLNPQTEGNLIRLPIPELSQERREEIVKIASRYSEQAKIAIRNIRRDAIENVRKLEKEGSISEDERFNNENEIQNLTDEYVNEVEKLFNSKQSDILNI
tara:strand:- start:206 stop:757 length:552 start_codon:yes stop_codon:yes gene_type:complete